MHKLLRTDGSVTELRPRMSMDEIAALIGAEVLCTVPLRHMGDNPLHVMLVDDNGIAKGRRFNPQASVLYRMNCTPAAAKAAVILGDAVVIEDYAPGDDD